MKNKSSKKAFLFLVVCFVTIKTFGWQYTVTNTADAGAGSLRQNINDALTNNGATATGGVAGAPHTIIFNIPGAAPFVINQTGGNHNMWGSDITIDATTQPGWLPAQNPVVVLRGTGGGESFQMNGTRMTLKGVIIQNFQYGINVNNNTGGNIVQNCWFGVDATGAIKTGNTIAEYGIWIKNGCSNFLIGSTTVLDNTTRCVVSGCNKTGIFVDGGGANVVISNCYVGTNAAGNAGLGNGTNEPQNHHGVHINNTAGVTVSNSVISYNVGAGIEIVGNSNNAVITGNYIGTDNTGNIPLGNFSVGIRIRFCNGHTIGGITPSLRNYISANGSNTIPTITGTGNPTEYDWFNMAGIYFEDVNNSTISGNYIGTLSNGNSTTAVTPNDMGNFYVGIKIVAWGSGSKNNTIGGNTAAHANIIGGNGHRSFNSGTFPGHGIQFQTNAPAGKNELNNIYKNYIGIGLNGTSNIGNRQDGVSLLGSVRLINVGGNGLGNFIGYNTFGIFIQDNCISNYMMGNYIGINPTGTTPCPNSQGGVCIQGNSTGNYIGRANAGEGNVISGNGGEGVSFRLGGFPVGTGNSNFVYNNIIGLQPDGVTPLATTNTNGIYIQGGSFGNTIGGSGANQRNIIAGNLLNGIHMDNGDANFVYGNNIGLDINGNMRANNNNGIFLENGSNGNTIGAVGQRNYISGNTQNGIYINNSTSNIIRSNYIGLTIPGTAAAPNTGTGILLVNVAGTAVTQTIIDQNVISANINVGIIHNASDYSLITGNTIGLNAAGTAPFPNGGVGMNFTNGSDNNIIGGNTAALRNIVSAHASHGIYFELASNNNTIMGNYVGLGSNGATPFGNGGNGVSILGCTGTVVGGLASGQGNIISNNGFTAVTASGVSFSGGSNNTSVLGNIIGLARDTITAAGNSDFGIWGFNNLTGPTTIVGNFTSSNGAGTTSGSGIFLGDCPNSVVRSNVSGLNRNGVPRPNILHGLHLSGSTVALVGGTLPTQRNILSGNTQFGLVIQGSSGNTVQGNSIGTDITGTQSPTLGNGAGGVNIIAGAANNIIGGVNAGESNLIGNNTGNGINVDGAASINNSIHRNSIFCNTLRGIVLSNGGNNNYARPTFAAAGVGSDITVTGPVGSYIEVFTLDGCHDCGVNPSSDQLQGRTLVFSGASPYTFTPAGGTMYTATASVANSTAAHNTSEFSICYVLCVNATAPTSVTISSGKDVCSNLAGSITLTAVGGSADPVEWYTGSCGGTLVFSGNPLVLPAVPPTGEYIYYLRKVNGCGSSTCIRDTLRVHANPVAPTSAAANTPAYCAGASGNTNLTATGGSGEQLVWYQNGCGTGTSIGSGTPLSLSIPASTTNYFVRWESVGCSPSTCEQTTITINPLPTPAIAGLNANCSNTSSNYTTPNSGNTFVWSFNTTGNGSIVAGAGTNAITLDMGNANGTLSLTETTAASCSTTVTLAITATLPSGTTALAGTNGSLCVSAVQLAANNTAGTWTVYSGTGNFSPDANTYNATVSGLANGLNEFIWTTTGTCGFISRDTVAFTVGTSGLIVNAATNPDTACVGTSKDIQSTVSGTGSGNYTYTWTTADNSFNTTTTSPVITVTPQSEITTYYVTVTDNQNTGCNAMDTVNVIAIADQLLRVPNLITPNEDGLNDALIIKDEFQRDILPGASMVISNRWGDRVYNHTSYDNTWSADKLTDGIYYYYIDAGCGNRKYKGWVQVIR